MRLHIAGLIWGGGGYVYQVAFIEIMQSKEGTPATVPGICRQR